MDEHARKNFDRLLEEVLDSLPEEIHQLLEEAPLVVDDEPSDDVLEDMGLENRDYLCGLYTGIPLTRRSVEHSGTLPEVISIFRQGIIEASRSRSGRVGEKALRRQIRMTVLHEIGHHFGMTEDDLRQYGYQ